MSAAAEWIESGEALSEFRRVERLTHPHAAQALRFWEQRRADGIVIGRDVPSRPIAHLLNRVIVYEPVDDKRDLRVKLAGTAARRRFNRDITGLTLSELFGPDHYPVRHKTIMEAIETDTPIMAAISHRVATVEVPRLELLILPALAPNGSDRWALVFCFYF